MNESDVMEKSNNQSKDLLPVHAHDFPRKGLDDSLILHVTTFQEYNSQNFDKSEGEISCCNNFNSQSISSSSVLVNELPRKGSVDVLMSLATIFQGHDFHDIGKTD